MKHIVTRSGTHVFRPSLPVLVFIGGFLVITSTGVVAAGVAGKLSGTITGSLTAPGTVALLAGLGVLLLALFYVGVRAPFLGVRVCGQQVKVTNGLRTYRAGTRDVTGITLERKSMGPNDVDRWVPRMHLADGGEFWLEAFSCGAASKDPDPQKVRLLDELRALIGEPAEQAASDSPEPSPTEQLARTYRRRIERSLVPVMTLILIY
jgi:hypothetical protein